VRSWPHRLARLEYLQAANLPVVAIDNVCAPDDPRLGNARLVQGDCRRREVLEQAGVRDCGGVLVLISNDLTNITTTLVVRSLEPEIRIVLRVFNEKPDWPPRPRHPQHLSAEAPPP